MHNRRNSAQSELYRAAPTSLSIQDSERLTLTVDCQRNKDSLFRDALEKGIEIRQRSITIGSWEIAALKSAYEGALESYVR